MRIAVTEDRVLASTASHRQTAKASLDSVNLHRLEAYATLGCRARRAKSAEGRFPHGVESSVDVLTDS
jgi:hypothetical protein